MRGHASVQNIGGGVKIKKSFQKIIPTQFDASNFD
jgi:hypothetical protein